MRFRQFSTGGRIKRLAVYVAGAFFLGCFALYNGYPIVNGDTATYLDSGFSFFVPNDRTIFYGLFIRGTSLGFSLWLTVFAQCLLLSWLLAGFIRGLIPRIAAPSVVGLLAVAAFGTIGGWYASQLMADVFTPVLFLAAANFLLAPSGRLRSAVLAAIVFFAAATHLSHCIISTLFSLLLLAASLRRGGLPRISRRRLLVLSGVGLLSWLLVLTSNYMAGKGFTSSKASPVFLMGVMSENGVLKRYLDKACPTENYAICAYKDSLPRRAVDFVWDEAHSPAYKNGGWEASGREYSTILRGIVSSPEYWPLLAWKSAEATARQLPLANIDEVEELSWTRYEADHPVYLLINRCVPHEINEFALSRQNQKKLNIVFYDDLYIIVLVVSSLICLFGLRGALRKEAGPVYLLTLLFLLVNAFATAAFANVLTRLNSRAIWLLPAVNAVFIYKLAAQGMQRLRTAIRSREV